jgi:hypothetical protein
MILLVFDGRSFGHYSFRSHELSRQDLPMARALERRIFDNATPFTEWSPAIFQEFELT